MSGIPLAGPVAVTVNGKTFRLAGDATYTPGGMMNERIVGPIGPVATARKYRDGIVEFESTDGDDLSLQELQGLSGATVQFVGSNGKVVTLDRADQVAEIDVSSADGKFQLRFEGVGRELV